MSGDSPVQWRRRPMVICLPVSGSCCSGEYAGRFRPGGLGAAAVHHRHEVLTVRARSTAVQVPGPCRGGGCWPPPLSGRCLGGAGLRIAVAAVLRPGAVRIPGPAAAGAALRPTAGGSPSRRHRRRTACPAADAGRSRWRPWRVRLERLRRPGPAGHRGLRAAGRRAAGPSVRRARPPGRGPGRAAGWDRARGRSPPKPGVAGAGGRRERLGGAVHLRRARALVLVGVTAAVATGRAAAAGTGRRARDRAPGAARAAGAAGVYEVAVFVRKFHRHSSQNGACPHAGYGTAGTAPARPPRADGGARSHRARTAGAGAAVTAGATGPPGRRAAGSRSHRRRRRRGGGGGGTAPAMR